MHSKSGIMNICDLALAGSQESNIICDYRPLPLSCPQAGAESDAQSLSRNYHEGSRQTRTGCISCM
jgi:hypothetical protein